jgi:integrase
VPAVLTLAQSRKAILWARRRKPHCLAWLALSLFAGLRPDAEADYMTWKDIDLDRKRIVITKSKVRVPRIVDLAFCPPALEWLRVAKELKSPLPLTHVTRRRYVRDLRAFLKFKRWPQDVLRHTSASNLLAFHQDAGKVAAFLGNSAGVLLRDYKALIFKEDADRFMGLLPKKRHFKTVSAKVSKEKAIAYARSKRWAPKHVQCLN